MSESGNGRRPVLLCILDGWGYREERDANAVALAETPVFDRAFAERPHCFLRTDGEMVGLPQGQFGNSEVGHMNLGAGRVVKQELPRIGEAIESGEIRRNEVMRSLIERSRGASGRVHILGLVSPGGVHSHQDHMAALANILAESGLEVLLHVLLDGRDTPPHAGGGYVARLEDAISDSGRCRIATLCGRYYAMDRDKRWERTKRAFDAIVHARAEHEGVADELIQRSYERGTSDEFVEPAIIRNSDGAYDGVVPGDSLLCINFRADRVRQIMTALVDPAFDAFERDWQPAWSACVGMASYSQELDAHLDVLFPPQKLEQLLGETVAAAGLSQLRMAETEKYPHVTFFFNGGRELVFEGEERILEPSPKVATYDLQPEMSARPLTDRLVEAIDSGRFDFILINYANPDMVGHTGDLDAAIKAVATIDECLGRLLEAVDRAGGAALVTADHGNCEIMYDPETDGPHTAHTTNLVPCFLYGHDGGDEVALKDGRLADVAPTILELLGVPQPALMSGESLLQRS